MALGIGDLTDRQVDKYIAISGVIAGYRSRYTEYILVKKLIIGANGIGTVSGSSGVKIRDDGMDPGTIFAVHDHNAAFVDHPCFCVQIGGHIF